MVAMDSSRVRSPAEPRLLQEGLLVRDDEPSLYIYRQVMHHRSQIGGLDVLSNLDARGRGGQQRLEFSQAGNRTC